jgi:hypothetical protein
LDYTDNVRVETSGHDGLTAEGSLTFDAHYRFTKIQELSLSGAIRNRIPIFGPGKQLNQFSVSPGSALRFTVYVRAVRISPFLRYTRSLDPVAVAVVSNTEILDQSTLSPGVQVDLGLRKANLSLLVMSQMRSQKSDSSQKKSARSDSIAFRVSHSVSSTLTADLSIATSSSSIKNGPATGSRSTSASGLLNWIISRNIRLSGQVGGELTRYFHSRVTGDVARNLDPTVSLSVDHRIRPAFSYSLLLAQSIHEGVGTNYYVTKDMAVSPTYQMTKSASLRVTVDWLSIRESGPTGEVGRRRNYALGFLVATKANASLQVSFSHSEKTSTLAERAYRQNRITISVRKEL